MLLEVFRDQLLRTSVYTPTEPMPVHRRGRSEKELTERPENEPESSDDTLPYGLVERLAGHNLSNSEETQSLLAHQGSLTDSKVECNRSDRSRLGDSQPVQTITSGEQVSNVALELETSSGERAPKSVEKAKRYPTRNRKKLNKYGEEFLRRLESDGAFWVERIDGEVHPFFHSGMMLPPESRSTREHYPLIIGTPKPRT